MNKIKELWNNKKARWGILGGAAALVVIAVVVIVLLAGQGKDQALTGVTVTVKTEQGMALEGVGVYVYTAADKQEMISFVKTDKDGKAAISAEIPAGSVAVLEGTPTGFLTAPHYTITQADTQIALKGELQKDLTTVKPGDMMFEFSVTDTDGTTHTLSELLKTNKAVVLNLWYTTCGPCQAEFPFLQEAFDQYGEGIALLGLNSYANDNEAAVATFKAENGLSFPMAKCDAKWETVVQGMAYPTTIIIDRYGMVSAVRVGSIDDTNVFAGAFQYYTAEDYVQSAVADINSLKLEVVPGGEGTEASPLEIGGVTEFEITVKPGEKVYCDLYKASGMLLRIEDAAALLTYNGNEVAAVDGVIETLVKAEDTFSPVKLVFGSSASEEKTFKVKLSFPVGTLGNPIAMELGDVNVKVAAGNDQGVYYLYKATQNGKLTLSCTRVTSGVNYGFTLYNLNSYRQITTGVDGEATDKLTIEVSAGDEVRIIVSTLPDEENVYPTADFQLKLSFEEGEETPDSGNQGGSTGGNQGGSTGGNQGGSTGGNQGGSTGGNQGGTTGGNQGGSQSGSQVGTPSGEYEEIFVESDTKAYIVKSGSTAITLASGQVNYFIFTPEQAGKYKVSISAGTLSYWGGNTVGYIAKQTNSDSFLEKTKTSFTVNFVAGQVGSVILIGVEGSGTTTLTVTRTGNANEEKPWQIFNGVAKPTSPYTYTGGSLSVVDIKGATTKIYLGNDGYYHWGSPNGSVIYVKLNDKTDNSGYLSFDEWLNSERPVIKAATSSGKWDFTECMKAYNKNKDKATGYYPLNDDLKFMLQALYEGQQWKDSIFAEVSNLNEDMAWMFCCYYQK